MARGVPAIVASTAVPAASRPSVRSRSLASAPQLHVAEGVDIDDLGDERAVTAASGPARGDGTRVAGSSAGPSASSATPVVRWAAAGAKMSRPWKLDETTGRRYSGRRQLDRLGDPAQAVRRAQQESVVRPDQDVAARHRARRPAGVPSRRPGRRPRRGRRPGGTAARTTGAARRRGSRNLRTSWLMSMTSASGAMPDDPVEDAGGRVARAEVGQERDHGSGHGRAMVGRVG